MNPTFKQIWNDGAWFEYWLSHQPIHTREYYKLRSAVRVAIWMPITVYVFLGLTGWL